MARPTAPVVITANDLIEGDSVFLGPEGWVRDIASARVARTPGERAALEAEAAREEGANRAVAPYAVEVSLETGAPVPLARRERIRADGRPTIPVGPAEAPARAA